MIDRIKIDEYDFNSRYATGQLSISIELQLASKSVESSIWM